MLRSRHRRWPVSWRQSFAPRLVSQSVRHGSDLSDRKRHPRHHRWTDKDIKPSLQPTASAIIRFALTGTTVANKPNPKPAALPIELRHIFSKDWSSDAAAPPSFWAHQQRMFETATPEKFAYGLYYKVQNLLHLQVFIQRYVYDQKGVYVLEADGCHGLAVALERCQRFHSYQEILAALNAIITRIQNLGCHVSKHFHALAIHYASLAFSAAAMRPHLKVLSTRGSILKGRYSAKLVASLLFALRGLESQQLRQDTAPMRRLISPTNRAEPLEPHHGHHLYARMSWNAKMSTRHKEVFMPLLAELGMDDLLDSMWEATKNGVLSRKQLWPIYFSTACMVKNGNSSRALAYLTELSELFDGALPHISEERNLNILLEDPKISEALPRLAGEQERLKILEVQLRTLETRLGVSWDPDTSVHAGLSDPDCDATGKPLFDMDGESPGYDANERLVTEIMELGCSKSVKDLAKIANLLDDYEGEMVPISTPLRGLRFAWCPERFPMKPSDTFPAAETNPSSGETTVSSLGLVRLRLEGNQICPAPQYPLHFIQLGRLLMQRAWTPEWNRWRHISRKWKPTDYIVGWDRVHARFILVFAHPHKDVEIRCDFMKCRSIAPSAGCLNADFGEHWFIEALEQPLRRAWFRGCLEEDPALDLVE